METSEDTLLWKRICHGDKKAFNSFFTKYYTLLYSYGKYYVQAEDAEEVVQDIMMWLWEKREEFSVSGPSMQQYLLTSVKNRCLMLLRKRDLELPDNGLLAEEKDRFYETHDPYALRELQALVARSIKELPDSYRQAFLMHRMHNKTRQEIADQLGISIKTVDYRIQESLKILRKKLKDYLPLLALMGLNL